MRDIQPDAQALRPASIGPRFREIAIEDLVGAPRVDDRLGGIDLSPDGREVAFSWDRPGSNEIFVAPVHGERIYQLTASSERSVSPRWSPDGQWIAFLRDAAGDERFQIWVMRRDGLRLRQLSSASGAGHRDIAWSPDGTQLAFVSNSTAHKYGLEIVDVATGQPRALSKFSQEDARPCWSPDGRWLVFSRDADLHLAPAAGGEAIRLEARVGGKGESVDGRWSPDGKAIAFTTSARGRTEIALAHLDGTAVRRVEILTNSPHPSTEAGWRPDGRGVVYLQGRDQDVAARRVFVASHADSPVADLPGVHASVRIGPDSETLAFTHSSARRPADVWVRLQRAVAPQPITTSLSSRVDPETLVEPVFVRYPGAGGDEVSALLYVPHIEALRGDGVPPGIVRTGRGQRGGIFRGWDPLSQWLAHRGYVVLVPAGEAAADGDAAVAAGAAWLVREFIVDAKRLGALDGRWPMTLDAITHRPDVRAAGGDGGAGPGTVEPGVDLARRVTEWFEHNLRGG